jgi:hypothetical protein
VPIGERNRMALAALPPSGDVVSLWGALHLPGLAIGAKRLPGEGENLRMYADPAGHPFCPVYEVQ